MKKIICYLDEVTGSIHPSPNCDLSYSLWMGPTKPHVSPTEVLADWEYLEESPKEEVKPSREVMDTSAIVRLTQEADISVDDVNKLREAGMI